MNKDKKPVCVPRFSDITGKIDDEQKRVEREHLRERLRFHAENKKYGFTPIGKGMWKSHIEKSRSV